MEASYFSGAEKRRFERLNKQFAVRFLIEDNVSKGWDMVLIKNINKGGLLFTYGAGLREGMILSFKINVALNKAEILCSGKVIRIQASGNPKVYEIGIEFTKISESDAEFIDQIIKEFSAKNPDR